jgi:hypothetical protein
LARLKAPTDLRSTVGALGASPVGEPFAVTAIVLFQSRTRRTGAEYEERARIPLGGGARAPTRDPAPRSHESLPEPRDR